jgi:hypothetical protein
MEHNPDRNSNLKPPFNSETGRAAGSKRKRITEKRRKQLAFLKRKWCNLDCVHYYSCPFPDTSKDKYEGKCALKTMPPSVQGQIADLLIEGKDGTIGAMRRIVAEMSANAKGDFRRQAILFDKIQGLHETLHGKFVRQEVKTDANISVSWDGALRSRKKKKGKEPADNASQL